MKKFSLLGATLGAALICAAAPLSLHWSPAKTLAMSVDTADARIGRPLTPMSVAALTAECIVAHTMAQLRQAQLP